MEVEEDDELSVFYKLDCIKNREKYLRIGRFNTEAALHWNYEEHFSLFFFIYGSGR